MNNNDILIRLRYALNIKNTEMIEIFKLGGIETTKEDVILLLKKTNDHSSADEVMVCTTHMLNAFLNGFIVLKRGKQESKPGQPAQPEQVDENINNILLKKIKIALKLTSEDMLDILERAGVSLSKSELGAVLRKVGHRNYKECGDRYARNFLKGLALKYKG